MVESLTQPVRCFEIVGVELKGLLVERHGQLEVATLFGGHCRACQLHRGSLRTILFADEPGSGCVERAAPSAPAADATGDEPADLVLSSITAFRDLRG